MNKVPFTAYLRVVPNRGSGRRFEIRRSLEKISATIYDSLNDITSLTLATPGSSGVGAVAAVDDDSLSNLIQISAVRPQFGQFYNMVTIVGFVEQDSTASPYGTKTVFHAGSQITGPASGGPGWDDTSKPSSVSESLVSSLKTSIENVIDIDDVEVRKIDLNGIIWGEDGHHFPL